jgi:hypothetical protein
MSCNPLLAVPMGVMTDSYKASHFLQYPDALKMVAVSTDADVISSNRRRRRRRNGKRRRVLVVHKFYNMQSTTSQ